MTTLFGLAPRRITNDLVSSRNVARRLANHICGASDTHVLSDVSVDHSNTTRRLLNSVTSLTRSSKAAGSNIEPGILDERKSDNNSSVRAGRRVGIRVSRTDLLKAVERNLTKTERCLKIASGG